jgi:hypothetical protein
MAWCVNPAGRASMRESIAASIAPSLAKRVTAVMKLDAGDIRNAFDCES